MLEQLRWRLTLWFVGLSMMLYFALSIAAMLVFDYGLGSFLDEELRVVSREVRPDIDYSGSAPTLKAWATKAASRDIELLATVQLFSPQGALLEQYGPSGCPKFVDGYTTLSDPAAHFNVRSRSIDLVIGHELKGYLQIQLPLRHKNVAMERLFWTIVLLAPFLLAGLGICGYFFARKALAPTEESLGVLKRFVADAGHELATPISVILGSAETLERKLPSSGIEIELVSVIIRAAERMDSLAKDLVLLAKMERPQTVSPLSLICVDELIKSVVEDLSALAATNGIRIVVEDLHYAQILSHEESLRTLISNLVKNAIMYTESGGTVSLTLARSGSYIQIGVADTGIGIPAESLPRIFERFYRADKSRSRSVGGSGLGLAIVKAIVQALHGQIRVESAVGLGSKFTVTLPATELSASS